MIKKLWHDGNDRLLVSAFNGGMRVFDERQGRFSDLYMNHPASGQPLSVYDFAKEGDRGIWLTDPDAELMYKDASTGCFYYNTFAMLHKQLNTKENW